MGDLSWKLRGVHVSDPGPQPFGMAVRIVEWHGEQGKLMRRVVPASMSRAKVRDLVRTCQSGTQYLFLDVQNPVL